MELVILITWLLIINGALGGQYILNWMGNQERFVGNKPVGVSPGVMTWWREVSKFAWAFIAVIVELARGKKAKFLWPGIFALVTIMTVSYTHLRAHETVLDIVCRLLLEKKKKN